MFQIRELYRLRNRKGEGKLKSTIELYIAKFYLEIVEIFKICSED